ncbi:MAG: hypothetical protein KAQ98_02875 [Bacteriovoracaceae bacterium]|nr:hypothetical protein [Bacteriovoracaceae bacterium]
MHFIWNRLFLLVPATDQNIPRLGLSHNISSDRRVLTIKLRKGVLWHDETPFTAKDVKASILIKYAGGWGDIIRRIKTPDDYTVIFEMREQIGAIDEKIIFNDRIMAPYHIFGKITDRIEKIMEEDDRKMTGPQKEKSAAIFEKKAEIMQEIYSFRPSVPIGTGPFKFSFVTGSDFGLKKFKKGFEAKKISIDEIRILKNVSNDITWAYLIGGAIDVTHPATLQDVTEQILKLNPKTRLILPSDYGEFGFVFNTKKYPLSDIRFRKALAYGVKKDNIRLISYYYSKTVSNYNTGVLHSLSDRWLDKSDLDKMTSYDYNPEKTHQILKEMGFSIDKEGFYLKPNGLPLKLTIAGFAGRSDWVLGCEGLVSQLRKLHIRAEIKTYEGALFHQRLAANKFDIAANFGADYRAYAHPLTTFERYFGNGAYIKSASGMPDQVKYHDGTTLSFKKELHVLNKAREPGLIKKTVGKLAWAANEYLPFLSIYEKNLMIFVVDGKRVKGWPSPEDPIWSASSAGMESVFAYLISTGIVRSVKEYR